MSEASTDMNEKINNELGKELSLFEEHLRSKLPSKNGFLSNASSKVIFAGGKRLRPALTISFAMAGKYEREKAFNLAAAIEILHTATLVHDDIVDNAKIRRGQPTINEENGTQLAVYTGDYLFIRAVSMLSGAKLPYERLEMVTKGLTAVCLGEVDQYFGRYSIPTVYQYLKKAIKKTGIIFGAACGLGAFSGALSEKQIEAGARFGIYFGAAFQIKDDLLDLEATEKDIGKPILNDLKEGIITLPVLLAAGKDESIKEAINLLFKGQGEISKIAQLVMNANGIEEANALKQKYIEKALKQLTFFDDGNAKEILKSLLEVSFGKSN